MLNKAERNYNIYGLELYTIVRALRHWQWLLAGVKHKIKIYSDHKNLQYWKSPQHINQRIAREVLELSEYDYKIHHVKGKENTQANALLWRPDYYQGEEDNKVIVVFPEEVFTRIQQVDTSVIKPQSDKELSQQETVLAPWINAHNLQRVDNVWYKDGRQVITGDTDEKWLLIQRHHDPPVHGHPGIACTTRLVEQSYWWPGLQKNVMEYIKGCAECQQNKVNTWPTHTPLVPITPRSDANPFKTIALDFITKLPKSQNYSTILTITDHDCTKASIFIPCTEKITAEGTAMLYVQHVFTWFGLPSQVISDWDPHFASKFTRKLCHILGISQNVLTAYHPRMDGQLKQTNQLLISDLSTLSDSKWTGAWTPSRLD